MTAAYAWKTMGGQETLTHREESREQCDARQSRENPGSNAMHDKKNT
ncbi:hypothetical protein LFDSGCCC_CDS0021 [Phage C75C1]|nr:hypothetical protein LFDSGCCC_CDS0021 [Phage C75C1]